MVLEHEVVSNVADKHCHAGADSNVSKKKVTGAREQLAKEPAAEGEQVAAKVLKSNEDGSWILGNVLQYDASTQTYVVQDEGEFVFQSVTLHTPFSASAFPPLRTLSNIWPLCMLHLYSTNCIYPLYSALCILLVSDDMNRVVTLSYDDVRRLDDSSANLRRGDLVLAVFPETTSFYRAVVVKTPKVGAGGANSEVVVKFKDDEDEAGRQPARRVPSRFVLVGGVEEGEESEDED